MARRKNELFIGADYLNIDGQSIKHPALIKLYATVNVNKVNDKPINLIGLDLETNHQTAELKLVGIYDGENYVHYLDNFLTLILTLIKKADWSGASLAYWNKLDPFVLFKQFLLVLPKHLQIKAMQRYGKIGGEWDRSTGEWSVDPVVEVVVGDWHFGIKNVIRSSIQFFKYKTGEKWLNTVWAFDIAQLYKHGLEREMKDRKDLFPYYSKIDESAHRIDWSRFETDMHYRKEIVLKSNELDARAVYDLGGLVQIMFKNAFGYYPNTLVSTGSLARASIIATLLNKYKKKYETDEHIDAAVLADVQSIGFINYYDYWLHHLGDYHLKNMYCMVAESYSGGYIENIRYGYTKTAYYADLASAYPAVITGLYDLRGANITHGAGEPPHKPASYCFIRGTVKIPLGVQYHPITVKHPINTSTNIRAVGEYIATYTLPERDYLVSLGATFHDEYWYNFQTTGKPSPLAEVVRYFLDLRKRLKANGDSAEYIAKIAANSVYGILFECVDTWQEMDVDFREELERADSPAALIGVVKAGYRAGEFFNPIYAPWITAETRIKIAKANNEIEKAGGKPILIMTDATFWQGTPDMLPTDMIREPKTTGYFERPEQINDLVTLGSGRYSFRSADGEYLASKNRGLNAKAIHAPDGLDIDGFNWINALKVVEHTNSTQITVDVRSLISVGMVLHNGAYSVEDLGLITDVTRDVDVITGLSKRILKEQIKQGGDVEPRELARRTVGTDSIYLSLGMFGDGRLNDQTLPRLRSELMKRTATSAHARIMRNRTKASVNYVKRNRKEINMEIRRKYKWIKEHGYDSKDASRMSHWSVERIQEQMQTDGKNRAPDDTE